MSFLSYNKNLKQYSRDLRNSSTKSEVLLWTRLRKKQISNIKFTRQKPILNYIVDFYAAKLKLVIEIDGITHDEIKINYDQRRQKDLENLGLKVLRFSDQEIYNNFEGVISTIEQIALEENPSVSPF